MNGLTILLLSLKDAICLLGTGLQKMARFQNVQKELENGAFITLILQ